MLRLFPFLVAALAALAPGGASAGAPSTFRVLEWNVSNRAWIEHRDAARAVLRSADPDIVVLVQVSGDTQDREIHDMLAGLRGPEDTNWSISSRTEGDYERTVIATRRPLRALPEFARVMYPDSSQTTQSIAPPPGEKASPKDTVEVIRTNAALLRVADQRLLVVGVHLTCCGAGNDWREARRRLAAAVVRDRIRSAVAGTHPDGIVIAGDMNLVHGRTPLDIFLSAVTNPPLGPLRRAPAVHPDGWTDWTWDGRGTPFNAGRLDNVVYSAGSLELTRARVWDTEFMDPDTLRARGLTPETSRSIGRHRPVVVDLHFTHE